MFGIRSTTITRRDHERRLHEYEFELVLPTDSEVQENLELLGLAHHIVGRSRENPFGESHEVHPVFFRVDPSEGTCFVDIQIQSPDREGHIQLTVDLNELNIEDEDSVDEAMEKVVASHLAFDGGGIIDTVEELIDSIPTGDPIVGCLVRSTASTVLGETAKCFRDTGGKMARKSDDKDDTWLDRVKDRGKAVLGCVGAKGIDITYKVLGKTIRCTIKGGF